MAVQDGQKDSFEAIGSIFSCLYGMRQTARSSGQRGMWPRDCRIESRAASVATKKKILLHIGHGKTGTSATQHLLSRNAGFLRDKGILYPDHPHSQRAAEGKITSGNVTPKQGENWFDPQIIDRVTQEPDYHSYVFSSEHMFWAIHPFFPRIAELAQRFDIRIVQAVREPLEMLRSAYGQSVKQAGYSEGIAAYVPQERHIIRAGKHLEGIAELGLQVSVLNYSVLKRGISNEIFRLAGLDAADFAKLDAGPVKTINRSLTQAELQLFIGLNKHFPVEYGQRCSNELLERLPDIDVDEIDIPLGLFRDLHRRVSDSVDYVNGYLPADQKLKLEFSEAPKANAQLSAEQVNVLFGHLANIVSTERDRLATERDRLATERDRLVGELDQMLRKPWVYFSKAFRNLVS